MKTATTTVHVLTMSSAEALWIKTEAQNGGPFEDDDTRETRESIWNGLPSMEQLTDEVSRARMATAPEEATVPVPVNAMMLSRDMLEDYARELDSKLEEMGSAFRSRKDVTNLLRLRVMLGWAEDSMPEWLQREKVKLAPEGQHA